MSASTLASVNPMHNKTPAGSAPMTLIRPLAFQSCCPGQRCPRGAYPSVRGMSWAKPLSSISTMGRASRSRAHKHQSFPETPAARPGLLSGTSGLFICHVICHARFAKRLPYGLRCYIKPRSAIILAGVGMVYHLLRKLLRVDLSDLPTLARLGAIRLAQRLIEAMPTENRSAVSPKLRHSFSRTERTCRPKGTGYVIINKAFCV